MGQQGRPGNVNTRGIEIRFRRAGLGLFHHANDMPVLNIHGATLVRVVYLEHRQHEIASLLGECIGHADIFRGIHEDIGIGDPHRAIGQVRRGDPARLPGSLRRGLPDSLRCLPSNGMGPEVGFDLLGAMAYDDGGPLRSCRRQAGADMVEQNTLADLHERLGSLGRDRAEACALPRGEDYALLRPFHVDPMLWLRIRSFHRASSVRRTQRGRKLPCDLIDRRWVARYRYAFPIASPSRVIHSRHGSCMLVNIVEYSAILGTLVFMEGILAADNALVLAVLVSRLPDRAEQKKALLYGIVGAFVFRAIAVIAATWLIRLWYFKAAGALYLLWITAHYFISGAHKDDMARASGDPAKQNEGSLSGKVARFWPVVIMVELTDIAFSVDQIVAAVSLSDELWVVYTGGMLGIIAMRFAAGGFLVVIEKRPMLAYTGHILPAWIGVKLAFKTLEAQPFNLPIHLPGWIFWSVMAGIVAWGVLARRVLDEPETPEIAQVEEIPKES